jgi:hypothetical protein
VKGREDQSESEGFVSAERESLEITLRMEIVGEMDEDDAKEEVPEKIDGVPVGEGVGKKLEGWEEGNGGMSRGDGDGPVALSFPF